VRLHQQDLIEERKRRKQGYSQHKAFLPATRPTRRPFCKGGRSPLPPPPSLTTVSQPCTTPAARPRFGLTEPKFVLHLFAGRRRPCDLQHWLELLSPHSGLWVLSLDIVLSRTHGDLACPANVARWLSAMESGRILAVIAGPPCETWSVARHSTVANRTGSHRPRPLRTVIEPWGITGIRLREQLQVSTANTLLQTTLLFFAAALRLGVSMVLEHPSTSQWRDDTASIWRLPELVRLAGHPAATTVSLHQCACGAKSPKPTTLLCAHLPQVQAEVARLPAGGTCPHPPGFHMPSIGLLARSGPGHDWATSSLKEYPSRMCQLLATAVLSRWHWAIPDWQPCTDLPDSYRDVYQPLDRYLDYELGTDYAPLCSRC
jgi:hypothetical protein